MLFTHIGKLLHNCHSEFARLAKHGSESDEVLAPDQFRLLQNYPNPFNPSTVISWNLAAGSFVSLKVYDFLGREIAVLINEEMPAGSHSLEFSAKTVDTSELASGTYFYKLHAGQNYEVRKMVLIR